MNQMKNINIEKITLNIGAGKDQDRLKKGLKLLKSITGSNPVTTVTNKRIAAWALRPGLPIGCKVTLRKERAVEVVTRLLAAKDNKLDERQFDDHGNVSFGIVEYIDIPKVEYDPEIGIIGLEVCITLQRPGYRIKKRRTLQRKIHKKHAIDREEAINFMRNQFNLKVGEDQ